MKDTRIVHSVHTSVESARVTCDQLRTEFLNRNFLNRQYTLAEVNSLIGLREANKGYGFVVWMAQGLYYQKYGKPTYLIDA